MIEFVVTMDCATSCLQTQHGKSEGTAEILRIAARLYYHALLYSCAVRCRCIIL